MALGMAPCKVACLGPCCLEVTPRQKWKMGFQQERLRRSEDLLWDTGTLLPVSGNFFPRKASLVILNNCDCSGPMLEMLCVQV